MTGRLESGSVFKPHCGSLKMEILLALCTLGVAAYLFFRNHSKWGLETVRSQVFLSGLHSGNTVSDANYAASFGFIVQLPPEVILSATPCQKPNMEARHFHHCRGVSKRHEAPASNLAKDNYSGFDQSPQKNIPPQVKAVAR